MQNGHNYVPDSRNPLFEIPPLHEKDFSVTRWVKLVIVVEDVLPGLCIKGRHHPDRFFGSLMNILAHIFVAERFASVCLISEI